MLEGEVDQAASQRFYLQDRDAGFALICTGRPRSDLVLRPGATEVLALQACHPRFFASHRYIVYARPVRVVPARAVGPPYEP